MSKNKTGDPYRERGRRRILTTVYLEADQHRSLKDLSSKTGVPMAALIRRGIDRELEARLVDTGRSSHFEQRKKRGR